ncbi:MAG: MAPEG family protein [Leptospiraceae bacterium]|nr:MAPEG family protein [Leptospiraceae bacterium]MCB1322532.1 MAPEG family protein [Leptospiraceae bacterium]
MIVLIICILIAGLLPYIAKIPVAVAMRRAGGYDNHHPREQQNRLVGMGKRAVAAHYNFFEAFPFFAAGVIVYMLIRGLVDGISAGSLTAAVHPQDLSMWIVQVSSILFLVLRLAYLAAYLGDLATLRSLIWSLAYIMAIVPYAAAILLLL